MGKEKFVRATRLVKIRNDALRLAKLCDELLHSADMELELHVGLNNREAQAQTIRLEPATATTKIEPISIHGRYGHADAIWDHGPPSFTLDEIVKFMEPRLEDPPARLRDTIRQALKRDSRYRKYDNSAGETSFVKLQNAEQVEMEAEG